MKTDVMITENKCTEFGKLICYTNMSVTNLKVKINTHQVLHNVEALLTIRKQSEHKECRKLLFFFLFSMPSSIFVTIR